MKKRRVEFLKKLIETPTPAGFETEGQKLILQEMAPVADVVETDVLGNAIGVKNPEGSPRAMLAGHCDEIGFMVNRISDEGFIYLGVIGAPRLNCASGQKVIVHAAAGDVPGVLLHAREHPDQKGERKDAEIKDFWVDVGARNRKDAEKHVSPGDTVTYAYGFSMLQNNIAVGRAFDDRIGAFVVAEVLKALKGKKVDCALFGVATVQEEAGSRGAVACGHAIHPDVAIAIDVNHTSDSPVAKDAAHGPEVVLGKGPVIAKGVNVNPVLFKLLVDTARENKIPCQIEPRPMPTWTDANPLQVARGGTAAALVGIPNRYMHAPTELVSLDDVEWTIELLAALIPRIKVDTDFRPLKAPKTR